MKAQIKLYGTLVFLSLMLLLVIYRTPPAMKPEMPNFRGLDRNSVANKSCVHSIKMIDSTPFPDIFLAINFNHPFYESIPILERFYKPLFPNYLFCGPERDPEGKYMVVVVQQIKAEYGYYGYQCLVEAMRRRPGMAGYLYVNDDMIINWWNFYILDKTKIWFPTLNDVGKHEMMPAKADRWWKRAACLERCSKVFVEMEASKSFLEMNATKMYLSNVGNERVCINALSDILYIPGRFARPYELITQKFYDHRVFLEVATPMTILMLSKRDQIIDITGLYLQKKYGWGPWTSDSEKAWLEYNYLIHFLHPYKLFGNSQKKNTKEFEDRVVVTSETILKDRCLDVLSRGKFWL